MLTPHEVSEQIETESERLQDLIDELREASQTAAEAKVDFEVKYAQQRLMARENPVEGYGRMVKDVVDDLATVNTAEERRANMRAAGNVMTIREAIGACKEHIGALRTLDASNRYVP